MSVAPHESVQLPVPSASAAAGTGRARGRVAHGAAALALSALSVFSAAAALVLTWLRLFSGMDLQDESFYVLVPWRWVLGDRPFVDEQDLLQIPGLLEYPFLKVLGLLRGNDPTGIMVYTRHLYLLLMVGVALVVFLLLRRLVRWQLALPAASLFVTYIFWATPQLSYNTMALAFLTLSLALGSWPVLALGRPRFAFASGMAMGLAVVAYPTLLFVTPFMGVLLAFAQGRRFTAMIAEGAFMHPPDPPGPPTGPAAWLVLRTWVLGGLAVLVPVALLLLSFGPRNLWTSWQATMVGAREIQQLGGASKAVAVVQGFTRLVTWRPYLLVAVLLAYLVYRRWPRLGRVLLALLPLALWAAAQRPGLWTSGFVIIFAFLSPVLYLFVPRARRPAGARLLVWVWAPSVIAGSMTAYTSALGYVNAAVGLAPAMITGGLFLAWALDTGGEPEEAAAASLLPGAGSAAERAAPPRGRPGAWTWLAFAVLTALVALTVTFQFAFQQRDVPASRLTSRFDSGPWMGIAVTPERRAFLDTFAADLAATAKPGDRLLVIYPGNGFYLYWRGALAAGSLWLAPGPEGRLRDRTIDYLRRHEVVPTVVVRTLPTAGLTGARLEAAGGGLGYPPALVRPAYVVFRKPAGETTAQVLERLSRLRGAR